MSAKQLIEANSDQEIRKWLCDSPVLSGVGDSYLNWESNSQFNDLTQAIKTVATRGTDSHVRETILRYARELVYAAYIYNYDQFETARDVHELLADEGRLMLEVLGTASGTIIPTFTRAAVSEVRVGELQTGEIVFENDNDAPTPDSGKSWEKAGWDVVVKHDGGFTSYQVKAVSKKPSESQKKESDEMFWIPTKKGVMNWEKAKVVEY